MHTPPSTQTEFPHCPHGPRAGTTTCLYCRSDARAAARQRRNRVIARFSLAAMGAAGAVALLVGGIIAIVPGSHSTASIDDQSAEGSVVTSGGVVPAERASGSVRTDRTSGIVPADRASSIVPAGRSRGSLLEPSVPEGRSALGDSIVAERRGGDVIVIFDTEALRTRFDWKFEGVVRATLPQVFGDDARVALDGIAVGDFVRGGNLIRDLPGRGIRLALAGDRALLVRPITREGRDGPLVIAYRASAAF